MTKVPITTKVPIITKVRLQSKMHCWVKRSPSRIKIVVMHKSGSTTPISRKAFENVEAMYRKAAHRLLEDEVRRCPQEQSRTRLTISRRVHLQAGEGWLLADCIRRAAVYAVITADVLEQRTYN